MVIVLPQFVSIRFQVLFHSPPGVLFTFPSRYLCTIGRQVVFSLGRWSSQLPTGFHVSRGTREPCPGRFDSFRLRGYHPLWPFFPEGSAMNEFCNFPRRLQPSPTRPHNPDDTTLAGYHVSPVWALPLSLATTWGITIVFFS